MAQDNIGGIKITSVNYGIQNNLYHSDRTSTKMKYVRYMWKKNKMVTRTTTSDVQVT